MTTTNEENTDSTPSTSQESGKKTVFDSPTILSMPKVVLTRIDEGGLVLKAVDKKLSATKKRGRPPGGKSVKRLMKSNPSKSSATGTQKLNAGKVLETRGRGRPKKDYSLLADMKPRPKVTSGFNKNLKRAALTSSGAKDLLKKTTLLKRSKIVIPPLKKTKSVLDQPEIENKPSKSSITSSKAKTVSPLTKAGKTTPPSKSEKITPTSLKANKKSTATTKVSKHIQNISPPKPKLLPIKNTDSDSSDDEFLYDELIEVLGNTNKNIINVKPAVENTSKTTNITLKPNMGNKPPTIVKGGIVKRTDLPPDLKSIASPSKLLISNNKRKADSSIDTGFPPKKASPWPISISPVRASPGPQKKTNAKAKIEPIPAKNFNSPSSTLPLVKSVSSAVVSTVASKSSITTVRPKIGPKQTAKVVPLSKPSQDDYMSDEYTEVETLEEAEHLFVKANLIKSSSPQDVKTSLVNPTSRTNPKDDSNQDLLKILSDETENPPPNQNEQPKQPSLVSSEKAEVEVCNTNNESNLRNEPVDMKSPDTPVETENQTTSCETEMESRPTHVETENQSTSCETEMESRPSLVETENQNLPLETETHGPNSDTENQNIQLENNLQETSGESTSVSLPVESPIPNIIEDGVSQKEEVVESEMDPPVQEEPPVRTVYDLMNDISLKYPSWNLHIIPETNAFCIAQVTKGRLGLPTLKKCIELDPESYYAKVYIHQYHIKRFDNVYDSEESILALIEEIHSIKA